MRDEIHRIIHVRRTFRSDLHHLGISLTVRPIEHPEHVLLELLAVLFELFPSLYKAKLVS